VQGNATILAIEAVPFSFKARAAQEILMQTMKSPFFTNLRTKQQTGYLVMSRADEIERHLFNIFAIQSNTHDGRDLLARFELFIETFLQEMGNEELTEEHFNSVKQSILTNLKQPPKSLSEMGSTLSHLAFHYDGDFKWPDKRIAGLEALTYEEFIEITIETMSKINNRRLAVIFTGVIPEDTSIQYRKIPSIAQIRKMNTYEP
jgi:insulysin